MLRPSIFNDNLFDDFFEFPFFDDRAERKLYGHNAKNIMKTDIKEHKDGYELEIDLPGFHKDEIQAELKDGYLTISAAKQLNQMRRKKNPENIFVVNATADLAREVSMWETRLHRKTSKRNSNMAF